MVIEMGKGDRRRSYHDLPIQLPADLYERLAAQAYAADREPVQQARWLLRKALGDESISDEGLGG
jgi:hypothetical protein